MIIKKIAVCGAPLAGKTTVLNQIAHITGSTRIRTWHADWVHRTRLDVVLPHCTIMFVTMTGTLLPSRVDLVSEILSDASAVMYVSSTHSTHNGENFYFSLYQQEAIRLKTYWTDIPWMFVLNTIDGHTQNPLLRLIPVTYHSEIISCVALHGLGVENIWQKIITFVS